jgi:hypothetical protein
VVAEDLDRPEWWRNLVFDQGEHRGPLFHYFDQHQVSAPFPWLSFDTGNASVARANLLDAGAFAEGYPGWDLGAWGLAEKELAYRLHCSGITFRFEPSAWALRQACPTVAPEPAERLRDLGFLFGKHPELRCAAMERLLL